MHLKDALAILDEIAFYLELKGENIFKINAFYNAVRNLSKYDVNLQEAFEKSIIENTKGVGKSILSILNEIKEKGHTQLLIDLRSEFPRDIYSLTQIRGLGAKKIKKLYDELNISNIVELEQACLENKLLLIPGFGEKTQKSILENIEKLKKSKGLVLLHRADLIVNDIILILNKLGFNLFSVTGEIRLRKPIISKIEFVLVGEDERKINVLSKQLELQKNENKLFGKTGDLELIFYLIDKENFASKLLETTGPTHFLEKINFKKLKNVNLKSEEELFNYLKIPFIPSPARENPNLEIKEYDFVHERDLKGLIHVHSNYSDGSNSIEEIAKYAKSLGYEYVLLCDHSKSAFYANGLDEIRLRQQWEEIEKVNSKASGITILKGIECDILVDGSLDFSGDILKQFDCVIASVHSRFNLSKEEMTKRITKALKNPYVKILGHLTGRLLLSRDPYQIDIEEIIKVVSQEGKSIELNCNPHRLDIDWTYHQKLIENKVPVTISPDAHSIDGFNYVKLGIDIATKGLLEKKHIVNCLSLKEFKNQFCVK